MLPTLIIVSKTNKKQPFEYKTINNFKSQTIQSYYGHIHFTF